MSALSEALAAWTRQGLTEPIDRWLSQELDSEGAPTRLPLIEWSSALDQFLQARTSHENWPKAFDERLIGFVLARLRFSRPDGGTATTLEGLPATRKFWSRISEVFPRPDFARVLSWWFTHPESANVPPPLPGWSNPDHALGVLRADWSARGDLLAFDQRDALDARMELFGAGVRWLGHHWGPPRRIDSPPCHVIADVPQAWETNSAGDVAEWGFRLGDLRAARIAVMLRGRRLALIGDQIDGTTPGQTWESRISVPEGLSAEPAPVVGSWRLKTGKPGKGADLIPIGEPPPSLVDHPRLRHHSEENEFSLLRTIPGTRAWMPLLVSWDPARRRRKSLNWSVLTVAEEGSICPAETAWAARVSWGRTETFVLYRSLGPPARRTFLGHTTSARFLLAEFTADGDVEPLVTLA